MNNMDKLDLKDATDEQIRAFARNFLNLDGADADAIKTVRKNVEAAWPQNFVWVPKPYEAVQQQFAPQAAPVLSKEEIEKKAGAGIAPTSSKNDPVVVLTIAKTKDEGGKDPVYVNVNGNAMHIERGVKQRVPYRYYFDLKQAVQKLHDWDERKNVYSSEDVERFPMNILQFPSEDEIFAFMQNDAEIAGQKYTRDMFDAKKHELMAA